MLFFREEINLLMTIAKWPLCISLTLHKFGKKTLETGKIRIRDEFEGFFEVSGRILEGSYSSNFWLYKGIMLEVGPFSAKL